MKMFVIFLALISPLFARLGETEEECRKRYGAEFELKTSAQNSDAYEREGIKIILQFRNGKCTLISYIRKEKGFSDNEIEKLQGLNYPGEWGAKEVNDKSDSRMSKDGEAVSFYYRQDNGLMITTTKELKASKEEKEKEENKALDGL